MLTLLQASTQLRQQLNQLVRLSDDEWHQLTPHLTLITLEKHRAFAQRGIVENQLGLVLDGALRQFYTKDGDERTTYFFFENQLTGAYMSCVTGQPSLVTIEALVPTTCVVFPYAVLKNLFAQYANWQQLGRLLAEYLMVGLEERMVSLLLLSPEERYIALLEGPQRELLQRVPQHYIANYLGITPVSMSRIRNRIRPK
jgi:CRP-like cAMP-binding protein